MDLSIVIPVYKGEKTIKLLFEKIVDSLKKTYNYEVIFVYDCGPDDSWKVIEQIKLANPEIVKAIQLTNNFGQHNAIICGFEQASGKFIFTMDEDLQHNPEDIFKLIQKQQEHDYDVVYGKYMEQKHSSFRNWTSGFLKRLLKSGIPELHTDYSAYRLIRKEIAQQTVTMRNSYTFLDGYLAWITRHIGVTEVSHSERLDGESSYNTKKLIEHTINIFVTFSKLPIRLLTITSSIVFMATIIYSIVLLIMKFYGKISVPGYASMMIFFGLGIGFMLFGLGVIGEYIYRINLKTTKRPNYIVRKTLN